MSPAHFFNSDAFLGVVADVHFPGATPRVVACEDVVARTLVHRGKAVSFFWNYPFYLPPVASPGATSEFSVPYLKNVVRQIAPVNADEPPGMVPALFIRWEGFPAWEAYERFAAREMGMRSGSMRRDKARLGREFGPVHFVPNDEDPAAFQSAIEWKAEQYRRSRPGYRYYIENNLRLYRAMRDRGLLMVSSLRAGNRIVAAQFSNHWERTLLYRLSSYDVELRAYSPGVIHLRYLLQYSYERGDTEFDFNFGREPYKYKYATHVRWLGQVGTVPRAEDWNRRSRMLTARAVGWNPAAYRFLRSSEAAFGRFRRRLRAR